MPRSLNSCAWRFARRRFGPRSPPVVGVLSVAAYSRGLGCGLAGLVLHPAPTTVEGCRHLILVGLELKTEIRRQSQAQRGVEVDFGSVGASYALCRSIDDVREALARAGITLFSTPGRVVDFHRAAS
jgi:hypothetical protein